MFHTITTTFISNIQFSCKFSTNQPKYMCYLCQHTRFSP